MARFNGVWVEITGSRAKVLAVKKAMFFTWLRPKIWNHPDGSISLKVYCNNQGAFALVKEIAKKNRTSWSADDF